MIELQDVKKSYPDGGSRNQVLCGINLTVVRGEFVAITGASGSGKTTLLSILGTLITPDSGTYILDGENILRESALAGIRNRKIGFVFQEHRLLAQLGLLRNILLPTLADKNRSTKQELEYAEYLMSLTGISKLANHYPPSVSGGEASRTALCRALVMKPLLLLADEPAGQLDSENARNIVALLKKVNLELGTTIILVSHSQETVAAANRILTLKDGLLS
jgi:ABC-type lipoprotein export system ATPase subunit